MHILLHIRGNAESKPGGDYNLLKAFAGLLRQRGHQAAITLDCAASLSGYDAVLTINLDSPFEPALILDRARRQGVPLCLYCLHHPMPAFAAYLRHGSTGARRVAAALSGWDPQRYLGLLAVPRVLLAGPGRWSCWRALATRRLQQRLLTGAAAVLVSSRLEREQIIADLPGVADQAHFAVVPHVFESSPADHQAKDRRLIVCPGRIESRKNQLTILGIVDRFPHLRFVFVGGLNPAEDGYCRRFLAQIAKSANACHIGGMDLAGFRALLKTAGVVVSASWFEVVSLSELDALAQGCRLVAGCNSYLREFTTRRVAFFDPASQESLANSLSRTIAYIEDGDREAGGSPIGLQDMEPVNVGRSLEDALQGAIKGRSP
jgi:glycosyltransferase involved in cell wall biosynthesis